MQRLVYLDNVNASSIESLIPNSTRLVVNLQDIEGYAKEHKLNEEPVEFLIFTSVFTQERAEFLISLEEQQVSVFIYATTLQAFNEYNRQFASVINVPQFAEGMTQLGEGKSWADSGVLNRIRCQNARTSRVISVTELVDSAQSIESPVQVETASKKIPKKEKQTKDKKKPKPGKQTNLDKEIAAMTNSKSRPKIKGEVINTSRFEERVKADNSNVKGLPWGQKWKSKGNKKGNADLDAAPKTADEIKAEEYAKLLVDVKAEDNQVNVAKQMDNLQNEAIDQRDENGELGKIRQPSAGIQGNEAIQEFGSQMKSQRRRGEKININDLGGVGAAMGGIIKGAGDKSTEERIVINSETVAKPIQGVKSFINKLSVLSKSSDGNSKKSLTAGRSMLSMEAIDVEDTTDLTMDQDGISFDKSRFSAEVYLTPIDLLIAKDKLTEEVKPKLVEIQNQLKREKRIDVSLEDIIIMSGLLPEKDVLKAMTSIYNAEFISSDRLMEMDIKTNVYPRAICKKYTFVHSEENPRVLIGVYGNRLRENLGQNFGSAQIRYSLATGILTKIASEEDWENESIGVSNK